MRDVDRITDSTYWFVIVIILIFLFVGVFIIPLSLHYAAVVFDFWSGVAK